MCEPLQRAVFHHTALDSVSVVNVEEEVNRLRVRIKSIQLTVPGSAFSLDAWLFRPKRQRPETRERIAA